MLGIGARDESGHMRGAKAIDHTGGGLDVKRVAELSMLDVSPAEEAEVRKGLLSMVEFADLLGRLDTEGVEPMAHIANLQNVFREDAVQASYDRDLLLDNAPAREDGCIFVPQVVE